MAIYAGSINRDHVRLSIGIPNQLSVSKAVQYLNGKSSHSWFRHCLSVIVFSFLSTDCYIG